MTDAASKHPAGISPPQPRKPYRAPELREFGKLHLKTQGASGRQNDSGTGKMAGM